MVNKWPDYGWDLRCCYACDVDPDMMRARRENWRFEKLGCLWSGEESLPWRDGEGIIHSDGLPPGHSNTWRRGIWTGGRWEAEVRTR